MEPHDVVDSLEQFALSLPEAWGDEPWGDRVVEVGNKLFVTFSRRDAGRPGTTVELPGSRDHGLSFPDAPPPATGSASTAG